MMTGRLLLAGALLMGAVAASPPARPQATAAPLEWMSGTWVTRNGDK